MALSKHPNVLRVYGSFVNGSKLYIVTPYLAAGSCLDIMKSSFPDGLDEISIATILRQALEGLIYLHKNGHIHRDVKAGNLLMDQQGTVLLADFGVSSSLAENGDVRKTFVGTPCWMAPEVMEQAGYDYKADIWSFGITALELATGHAPFAKFPPMKVLMMTLSNAPPTLDRENGKHKFSKYFKDMIDLCLQKEPNKRPTAEKLIMHPFFKQAKKRDYLVKSVLANVLPLDKRPHRKIPHKKIAFQTTEQWDFDDTQSIEKDSSPTSITNTSEKQLNAINSPEKPIVSALSTPEKPVVNALNTPEKPVLSALNTPEKPILTSAFNTPQDTPSTPLDRSKSSVQFDECPKPNLVKTSSIHASPIDSLDTPKKHISFGEAVIKDPSSSSSRSVMSPVVESPSPILSEPGVSVNYPPPTLSSAPLSKKSRFVIEDSAPSSTQSSHISPAVTELHTPTYTPPMSATEISHTGVGLGICTSPTNTVVTNINTVPTINNSTPSSAAAAAGLQEGEFKKGRFSVNQTPTRPATPVEDLPTDFRATPMARAPSQDSFQERKSRFEVKQGSGDPGTPLQSYPLTRENSNVSRDSTVNNNKVSRFSIEKPDGTSSNEVLPTTATNTTASNSTSATPATPASTTSIALSPECRKKGRFELTGGNDSSKEFINMLESPQSTVAPSPVISPSNSISRGQAHRILDPAMPHMVYSHMESLLKQTEIQKNMLHDLLATMPFMYQQQGSVSNATTNVVSRSRTISDSSKKPSIAQSEEFYQR